MASHRKIAIIGVGLLGGSLALALKKRGEKGLVGWNHRASSRKKASRLLPVAPTFEKAVEGAEVIVLCAHSASMGPVLKHLQGLIPPHALIMDVSSVKGEVARQAGRIKGMSRHFVPCHPMAGKEKSGPAFADGNLYHGKIVFVTPLPGSPSALVKKAVGFWKKVGAVPVVANPSAHDQAVALTSHLPHLLACALMELYGRKAGASPLFEKAVGSGFRDFTRIAGGNPQMWRDIVEMNSGEIQSILAQFRKELGDMERNLKKGKSRYWLSFFEKARTLREKLK